MPTNRSQFLILATLFEGSLVIVAFLLAWLIGINPFDRFQITGHAISLGLAATVPMLILFALTYRSRIERLQQIKKFLIETIGAPLSECTWYEMAWVALLAGFSEELLFRAVLQAWMLQWGPLVGLLLSNLLFGLAHAITLLYAILAGLLGLYLGALFQFGGDGNLLVPTLSHALYDLVAFVVIRRSFLAAQLADSIPPDAAVNP